MAMGICGAAASFKTIRNIIEKIKRHLSKEEASTLETEMKKITTSIFLTESATDNPDGTLCFVELVGNEAEYGVRYCKECFIKDNIFASVKPTRPGCHFCGVCETTYVEHSAKRSTVPPDNRWIV
jgi:hypothetical protein